MIYVFSFVLMIGALGYVALPLFRGSKEEQNAGPDETSELEAQKAAAYSAIKELRFDYELGNLSPRDHEDLETKYRRKAAQILKELDEMKNQTPLDDLEAEIMKKRKAGTPGLDDELEKEIALRRGKAAAVEAPARACPRCGKRQRAEAKFCTSCGASLILACPSCGKPYLPDDRFCPECGAGLKKENR